MSLLSLTINIGVNDQASGEIKKIASTIEKNLEKAGSSGGNLLSRSISKGINDVGVKASALGATIGNLLSSGFLKVGSAISSSLDSAISRVDTLNQYPKILQQMGYSADDAKVSINKLSSGIEGLPTSLDAIVENAKSLALSTGDLDKATDAAIALNDAFLASGSSSEQAESGMLQYTQMLSKGTVDMESWRTLQQNMKYALQETAEAMGFEGTNATNDLYEALKSGEVTFDQFQDALIQCDQAVGGFAETAAVGCAGIETSMSNAKTAVVKNLANMIDAVNGSGAISQFFDGVKGAINLVGSAILPIAEQFGQIMAGFTGQFSRAISQVQELTKSGMSLQDALGQVLGLDLSGLGEALGNLGDAFGRLFEAAGNFVANIDWQHVTDAVTLVTNAFASFVDMAARVVDALGPLGDYIPEIVALLTAFKVAADITPVATNIVDKIKGIGESLAPLEKLLSKIGVNVSASGSVVEKIMPIVQSAGSTISTVVTTIKAGLSSLWGVMLANPITIVIAAIAALVAGFIVLYNTNEDFRNGVNGLIETIGNFLGDVGAGLVTFFTETLPNAWNSVVEFVAGIPENVANFFAGIGETIWTFLAELPYNIGYAMGQIAGTLASLPIRIWEWLTQTITNVGNWVVSMGQGAAQAGSEFLANVGNFIMNLPGNIWNWLTETITNVGNWVGDMASKAGEAGANFLSGVGDFIMNLPGNVWNWLVETITNASNWAGDMRDKAVEAGSKFLNGLIDEIKQIPDRVFSIGQDIVNGIYNGIMDKWNWLVGTVQNFAGGFVDGFKDAFGIHSPSRVMKQLFGYVMEGAGLGITENTDDVVDAMEQSVDAVKNAAVFDATVTADGSNNASAASKVSDWVFNVTINANGSNAVSAGKSIAETLYTEMQRRERAFA